MPKAQVLFANQTAHALQRGFDQMGQVLAVTLGPTQGHVINEHEQRGAELLTDAATIARRIIALPDRAVDVGAMLMRNLAWRMHQRVGDGVATTAVLARALFNEAHRYRQAGGNPMQIKRGVDQATQVALAEITAQAKAVRDEEQFTAVAETITGDPALSLVLGEMFEVLGESAQITIEDYVAPIWSGSTSAAGSGRVAMCRPIL